MHLLPDNSDLLVLQPLESCNVSYKNTASYQSKWVPLAFSREITHTIKGKLFFCCCCCYLLHPHLSKALDVTKMFSQRCLCKLHSCWCPTLALILFTKLLFFSCNLSSCTVKKAPTIRPCTCNMTSNVPNHVWFFLLIFWDIPLLDSDFSAVK